MQGATVQTGDWLSQYSDDPERLRAFCVRQGLLDHLRTAIELAQRNFPPIEKLSVSMWTDPLEGTEKPRIDVAVRASFEETRAGYRRFVDQLVQSVPFPERHRIGFTYTSV